MATLPFCPAFKLSGSETISVLLPGLTKLTFRVNAWLLLAQLLKAVVKVTELPRFTLLGLTLTVKLGPPTTVNVVVTLLLLFDGSLPVMVIVCGPTPTSVPAAGLCDRATVPLRSEALVCDNTFGIAA